LNEKSQANNHWFLIKVTPSASRNEITGLRGGVLQVKIAAPPERGKANRELTAYLSRVLGVKKSAVAIIRGEKSRHKAIAVAGMSREEIIKKINT
jgi:uncharacterized protein (TIGR00251 family)